MASGSFWQAHVRCPYYKFDDGKHIHCEGVTDASSLRISFSSKTEYEKYIQQYCCRHPRFCLLFRAVNSTYEGVYDEN